MLHPLFSTLLRRPDLAMEHLSAYAALLQQEAAGAGAQLVGQVVAWALAVLMMLLFIGLAGVALMLGLLQNQFHWILVVVPGIVLAGAALALRRALQPAPAERFPELKAQLDSDAQALRMAA